MFRQSMEGVRIDFRVSCSFGCIIIAKVEGLELEMLRSLGCDVESSNLCCRRSVSFLLFFHLIVCWYKFAFSEEDDWLDLGGSLKMMG